MAANNLTSLNKLNSYSLLFNVNRSMRNVCVALHDLEATGLFDAEQLKVYRGLTRELQAQINSELLETLHSMELKEAGRWGKVRLEWEKWLEGKDEE